MTLERLEQILTEERRPKRRRQSPDAAPGRGE